MPLIHSAPIPHFVRRWLTALILAVMAVAPPLLAAAPPPPELRFEAPPELAGAVELLEGMDTDHLVPVMELLGLEDPGPPIRVVLAPEGSREAKLAPSWAVAYAFGAAGTVVLIPSRIPDYPDDDLEQVLRHEVAHVLVARASGRHEVPRWFNEGLALYADRGWGLEDQGRLILAAFHDHLTLAEVERGFFAGRASAQRAYAMSLASVRHLIDTSGDQAPARILAGVAEGQRFTEAFRGATGLTLSQFEGSFFRHLNVWHRWVPLLTSSVTLWIAITLLFLLAFARRKQRDAEMLAVWEAEERALAEQARKEQARQEQLRLEQGPAGGWVH
ncbi:MAG: hypothetical protein AAGN66_10065 [Acidobacteriota bacterium]